VTDTASEINEFRVRQHLNRMAKAVNTTDRLDVPATAADLLDALYALTRYWRGLDTNKYDDACRSSEDGKIVGGLTHLRGEVVHHAVVKQNHSSDDGEAVDKVSLVQTAANLENTYPERYYAHYGSWNWYANAGGGGETGEMYREHVAGREVMTTLDAITRFALHHLPDILRQSQDISRGEERETSG
jgi:hypothetical protein